MGSSSKLHVDQYIYRIFTKVNIILNMYVIYTKTLTPDKLVIVILVRDVVDIMDGGGGLVLIVSFIPFAT